VVPTSDYYTLIMKSTPRPNMAACFLSWMIGPEGSAQKQKYEFQFNDDKPSAVPASSQLVLADTPDKIKAQADESSALAKFMQK
jgi:ABC-type Fe3+ transport system substrate-binding protein